MSASTNNSVASSTPAVTQEQLNSHMDNLDITMQDGPEESVNTEVILTDGVQPSSPMSTSGSISVLRTRLENLTNAIALGFMNKIPKQELDDMKAEANETAEYIQYLEGLQKVYQNEQVIISTPPTGSTPPTTTANDRYCFLIPTDLPYWQWQGNVWQESADSHESVKELLDNFYISVTSTGLDIDQHWARLMPIRIMNRDQRSWFELSLKGRDLTWNEVKAIVVQCCY
ncbi:hypothetical protein BX666DRAFT_2034008 [Dichotomocladium elegans]|nr:hypothetical protein BX666DRAFT_2034008 [Dichotomocladium elegans]